MNVDRLKLQKQRGAVLLNVLIFLVVISILLIGMARLMVSDYNTVKIESNYTTSIEVAEAGINYELRKITNSATSADQKILIGSPGTSYTLGAGTFSVYVTQRAGDGSETTPWVPGNNLWIYSTGTLSGVSRTVKVAAKGTGTTSSGNYSLFGVSEGIMNTSATFVNSDVGTNGFFTFNGRPTITGSVIFNGPTSNWQSPPNATYNVVHNLLPVVWPTVESIATTQFGATGLNYLATNNDNALASPAISNNFILANSDQTFVGKAGGANYYVTSMTMNGSAKIAFNNSAGPITIWVGPSGSSTTFNVTGGTATVKPSADPTNSKAVRIYAATNNDIHITGSSELDASIYNVNNGASGRLIFDGNPAIYGMLIVNKFTFNNTPSLNAVSGIFAPTGSASYYQCVQPWMEVGGVN